MGKSRLLELRDRKHMLPWRPECGGTQGSRKTTKGKHYSTHFSKVAPQRYNVFVSLSLEVRLWPQSPAITSFFDLNALRQHVQRGLRGPKLWLVGSEPEHGVQGTIVGL